MKKLTHFYWFIALLVHLGSVAPLSALTVFDPTLVRINLLNAKKDLLQQIKLEANQKLQISRLERQIMRADDLLRRMGDPKNVDLSMVREILTFIKQVQRWKSVEEIIRDLQPAEVFQPRQIDPITTPVDREIRIDGEIVGERSPEVFAPEVATRRFLGHYREVQARHLEDRGKLNQKLAQTLEAVQRATTSSEVQKLTAVLNSLQTQLAGNDRELRAAADEVLIRHLHNQNEKQIATKARIQEARHHLKVGVEKNLSTYRLPSKPFLFPR